MSGTRTGRATAAAALATLAACAPPATANRPTAVGEQMMRVGTATEDLQIVMNRSGVVYVDSVPANLARAWAELPAVYQALGLPINGLDPTALELRVTGHQLRRIEGRSPSSFLDCGHGPMGGTYADSYQVSLTLRTRLAEQGGGTAVHTTVQATARPRALSGEPLPCRSLGTLEKRVTELLRQRTGEADG